MTISIRLVATCARIAESVKWAPVIECRMEARTEVYVVKGESFYKEANALKVASQHVRLFKDTGLLPFNDADAYQQVRGYA